VRRHTEHSAAVVLRHNPNRSELPRLPAVTDAKKAPAQRRDGGAAGAAAGGLASAGLPLSPELLMRLDGLLRQFLEGAYDLLMTQVGALGGTVCVEAGGEEAERMQNGGLGL
jgi:hypothetical protein